MKEFIEIDTGYSQLSTHRENGSPVIRLDFPDNSANNIFNRYKLIYLNAKTFLPYKVISELTVYGKKSATIYNAYDIEINKSKFSMVFDDINFLSLYKNKTGEGKERKQLVGKKAPEFTLNDFDGKTVHLSNYLSKVVVLDFWETWCSPCRESMPKLQAIYEQYNPKGLLVIGIHGDFKNIEVGKQILEKNNVTFMNLSADQKIIKDYDILAVPRYIVIDEQGKIIYSHEGYSDSLKDLIAKKFSN
jgi:peroxiredoxin